jgi:hypothetical protein
MMTLQQFEMALWTLKLLDMQELVDAGAIDDRDYETWDTFQADRMRWFLMNPARAPAVWTAIWRHKPKSQDENVIDLERHRNRS